jgi:hypothetical protein
MRKPPSRPERGDCGTSQTSSRRHPRWRSTRRRYAVAPIQYRGVAMRHVGPRDAAWVPLSISTWTASSPLCRCAPNRSLSGETQLYRYTTIKLNAHFYGRSRERLAWGAGGGNQRPCAPARGRRNPARTSLRRPADLLWHPWITSSLGLRGPVGIQAVRAHPQRMMSTIIYLYHSN